MSKLIRVTAAAGAFAVLLTAGGAITAAPAHAETEAACISRMEAANPNASAAIRQYNREMCGLAAAVESRKAREAASATSTPTYTPAPRSGVHKFTDGIDSFFSAVMPWVIGAGILLAVCVVWSMVTTSREEKETAKTLRVQDAGRRIVNDHIAAQRADGVEDPDRPSQHPDDLRRYREFSAVVAWTPGTAFASAVTRSGDQSPLRNAWTEACRAAKFGDFDPATNEFTPAATTVQTSAMANGRDARIAVKPRDLFVTEQQLKKVSPFLEKTLHVRHVGDWERDHITGWYQSVVTNDEQAQQAPEPEPQQAAPTPDPTLNWEW
ncbi:Uncharacterised protein [Mycobacteroides abscessus subsp. abscessus]|uniref:hypothetical protein n=1 Tax=Mycobacteroides abscessus TaxID=36809 RepID=UPI0009A6A6E3|nr:hypothetical protein [Mycobacteroides abscessus]SLJ22927.1 Uncharacterised protein [Mycobacteroides abscessus subsp. abscessus]